MIKKFIQLLFGKRFGGVGLKCWCCWVYCHLLKAAMCQLHCFSLMGRGTVQTMQSMLLRAMKMSIEKNQKIQMPESSCPSQPQHHYISMPQFLVMINHRLQTQSCFVVTTQIFPLLPEHELRVHSHDYLQSVGKCTAWRGDILLVPSSASRERHF